MINIEEEIYWGITEHLKNVFGKEIPVYGDSILAPSEFPCVYVEETDNYTFRNSRDSSNTENHAEVVYEVNAYSNKQAGKKSESKKILSAVDDYLTGLGFTRMIKNPITMSDTNIYRLFARYSAIISKQNVIYRR